MIEFSKFSAKRSSGSIPDLTPLIDMVFLLLIFFLLTSYLSRPAVTVNLPGAENTDLIQDKNLEIVLSADGSLSVNNSPAQADELYGLISEYYKENSDNEILILAHRDVPFYKVIEVMDISRRAGIYTISFLVEKEENE